MSVSKPSRKNLPLYRSGFKIVIPDVFIDTYLEVYNKMVKNSKEHKPSKNHYITRDEAEIQCYIICESIIICLDFGLSIWFRGVLEFTQKTATYVLNNPFVEYKSRTKTSSIVTITFAHRLKLKIRRFLNKKNEEWVKYREQQVKNFRTVKEYYKKLYGKEDEWWKNG